MRAECERRLQVSLLEEANKHHEDVQLIIIIIIITDLRLLFTGFFPEFSCPLTSISRLSSSSCFSRASSSRDFPALFLLAADREHQ